MNHLLANNSTSGSNPYSDITFFAVRDEYSVVNGSKRLIRQCPCNILRRIHGKTVGINRLCTKRIHCARGKDIIIRGNVYIVKNTGGSHIGYNNNAVQCGTLRSIAGNAAHGDFILTSTFRNERRRSTAVAVKCPFTAQGKHGFAFFIITETNRVICATAIIHNENQSTVLLDADHGTSGRIGCSLFCLGD